MNIVRRVTVADEGAILCGQACTRGRCCALEAMMGEACWCRQRVAMRGVVGRNKDTVRERLRIAERGMVEEAIMYT